MNINGNDRAEFLGNIMDAIEDFLEEKGIDIPNNEKRESDNPAILYGSDYGILCYDIERVLIAWGILEDDKWNQTPAVDVTPVIRCKDCYWYDEDGTCVRYGFPSQPIDYCSNAERKEE